MLSYCIVLYFIEFILPAKSHITALNYIILSCVIFCPKGLKTQTAKNIWGGWSGVGVGEAGLNRISW